MNRVIHGLADSAEMRNDEIDSLRAQLAERDKRIADLERREQVNSLRIAELLGESNTLGAVDGEEYWQARYCEEVRRANEAEAHLAEVRAKIEAAPCVSFCQENYRYCITCGGVMSETSSSPTGHECYGGDACNGETRYNHRPCNCWKAEALALCDGAIDAAKGKT